jgi:PHD/YefM family antitoxin component YafN of YafNO toxin-antitoxin module
VDELDVGSENDPRVTNVKTYAFSMKTISATLARSDLYRVIDSTLEEHEPVQITGKRGNVILVSEPDWRAIQETLYLVSMPGMRDSIRAGMAESIEDCSKEIDL